MTVKMPHNDFVTLFLDATPCNLEQKISALQTNFLSPAAEESAAAGHSETHVLPDLPITNTPTQEIQLCLTLPPLDTSEVDLVTIDRN
jgi:hypothetical protein